MSHHSLTRWVVSIVMLLAASNLQAKPNKPVPSANAPVITEALVTFADESNCQGDAGPTAVDTLTIMGTDFSGPMTPTRF